MNKLNTAPIPASQPVELRHALRNMPPEIIPLNRSQIRAILILLAAAPAPPTNPYPPNGKN